ncbi:hypothetical protein [Cupriavidus sp.]|uniref:hypothetical protein n=1 Tax=Cupriavidus sp. TaxID=1873897 RepID=UPI003D0FF974
MTELHDYYLHGSDGAALQELAPTYDREGATFDYIGQIPATFDADGVPLTYQSGYFANLRLTRQLEPGELSEYTIAPPETPYRVWAA